jgi:hypothetical protein
VKNFDVRYLSLLIVVSFALHIVWENAQAPLYAGYQSFFQHFQICFVGVIGDVLITLLVLGFVWLLKKDLPNTRADFLTLTIIGFVIAITIEQNALLLGKWSYAPTMPIIPLLKVGLTPIAQMIILLPLSFYIAGLFNKNHKKIV